MTQPHEGCADAVRVPSAVAEVCAILGDADEAMQWLEHACDERDFDILYIGVGRDFDSLRADQRFQDLVRRTNLP